MINELLQDRAALYVSGAMTAREREDFELILEFHDELRQFASASQDVGTAILLAGTPSDSPAPPARLKSTVLRAIDGLAQQVTPDAFVMTGPDRLVQWVNPAFVEMCGYSLEELRGKSLGPILQGAKTDPVVAARMRQAVHEYKPCHEQLVNYRKDGTPYWVDIEIRPILDDAGVPLWVVAREQEMALAA
ncbi:MAG: PAS domain-containing protein [Verrucomicrobiota bacterium]|nr:PAS domain-containing protein [Chthoniobacterales bacterium]MDQ3413796.1 PAS domain-containing protein [Verrucomicrobiota bacterium]